MIKIPPFVENLIPYKAGKNIEELARERNIKRIVKLASAENPLGPSPKSVEAIQNVLMGLNRYSDPSSFKLVSAIAKKYNVQPNHIVCSHGTDSILAYIVSAFTTEDDEIITSEGSFIGIYVTVRKTGRKLIRVPLKDYAFDLEAIYEAITDKTTMIYLANPNNPTGTMIKRDEFENLMARVPDHIMVILDEAYTAYVNKDVDYPNGLTYEYENMVVTRTFSKAYGLAGLRIGFAVGPDKVIEALYKVKLPFEPGLLPQEAALAALEDDAFLKKTIDLNNKSKAMLEDCFNKSKIRQIKSYTNFILIILPTEKFAAEFTGNCLNNGLIVRHVDTFGVPNGVRINTGTIEETKYACEIIEEVYKSLLNKHYN